ncbi:MAG: hypothetical protein Q4B16_03485, partial [Bacteroidia bacterium]|nr:hypothetical protein [Bacteroidia bacterium]
LHCTFCPRTVSTFFSSSQGLDHAANEIAGTWDVLDGGVKATVTINAENIKAKRGMIQIPLTQITLSNGVLKQNPGW